MKMPQWPIPIGYRNIDLGLARVLDMVEVLGNPHQKMPPIIHVAGTNGKGSTIAFMRAILEDAGYKVHIYTSPHLVEFNERYVVAGEIVSDKMLNEISAECQYIEQKANLKMSFFEGVTILAFMLFSRIKADVVLLETGLGGRLDATNVVEPVLSVITPISKDHIEYLGGSVKTIAREKAGIIKQNTPVISAMQTDVVENVLQKVASDMNSPIEFIAPPQNLYELSLYGLHQQQNAALAVAAIEKIASLSQFRISKNNIINGLKNANWQARMQELNSGELVDMFSGDSQLWLDGGHNEAAASAINNYMQQNWIKTDTVNSTPIYIICAMLGSKDYQSFIENLFSNISHNIAGFYAIPIPNEDDYVSPAQLQLSAKNNGVQAYAGVNVTSAIENILLHEQGNVRILICGSLYLAGDVLAKNK